MKSLPIILIIMLAITFASCDKNDGPDLPIPLNDSITMGAGYANDVYYSLTNGVVAEAPRTNWDIAFSVDAQSSAILINEAAGVELKVYPTGETWSFDDAVDTLGLHTWDNLFNHDTTWGDGAFGMNATGHPNYGWGKYNMTTHNVEGLALYIIKTRNGDYKKIFIENKQSMLRTYDFKYSNIDGSSVQDMSGFDVSGSNANFVYYSIDSNESLDREPDKATWDLVFTKFTDNDINYIVTGVLTNSGIMSIEKEATDFSSVTWTEGEYSDYINIVGYDWKSFNMDTYKYDVDDTTVFVIKDMDGNEYLLNFTAFDYTIGKFVFTILEK